MGNPSLGPEVGAVLDCVFAQYPHLARWAGLADFAARLPRDLRRTTADQGALRAATAAALRALPESGDAELRADLDTATRLLDYERFRVEELGQTHLGPVEVLTELDVADTTQLPTFLADATGALPDRLPAGDRLRAIEQARAAAVTSGDEDVAAALSGYADAIAATAPTPGVLGPELLAESLRIREGLDADADQAWDEVDAVRAELGEPGWVREQLAEHTPTAPILDLLAGMIDRLREFWTARDVVTVDVRTPLELRPSPAGGPDVVVEFAVAPLLAGTPAPHVLYVPAHESARFLNEATLEILAVHETFTGHYVQAEAARRGPSVLRAGVPWVLGFTEGWAHYTEELAVEQGLAEGRPWIRRAQLLAALESAVRLLAWLNVHSRRWTFVTAVDNVARLCDWSPRRAAGEVLAAVADPSSAMYTAGKLALRTMRAALPIEQKDFHDRIMRCGHAPLSTVARYAGISESIMEDT